MPEVAEFHQTSRLGKHASWTKAGPVVSHLPEEELAALEERATATIGDPSAFGLWGFATGTWIAALVLSGNFPAIAMVAVAPILLIFGGIGQFVAGLYAYRRAQALMATAFCCFGAFNTVMAMFALMQSSGAMPLAGIPTQFEGFLLLSFGFIALALTIAALQQNMVTVIFLGTLCIGYTLTGIPFVANAFNAPGWAIIGSIGAYFLMASSFFAAYLGMAIMVNSMWKRTVLPIMGEP